MISGVFVFEVDGYPITCWLWEKCVLRRFLHYDVIKWKHFPRYGLFFAGNSPVIGEFPAQRPVTRSFDVFFELRLNKGLSKQSWGWWFEMLSWSWCHCNVKVYCVISVWKINSVDDELVLSLPDFNTFDAYTNIQCSKTVYNWSYVIWPGWHNASPLWSI